MASRKPRKGKARVKIVRNPKTGRTRKVSYGQAGKAKGAGPELSPEPRRATVTVPAQRAK